MNNSSLIVCFVFCFTTLSGQAIMFPKGSNGAYVGASETSVKENSNYTTFQAAYVGVGGSLALVGTYASPKGGSILGIGAEYFLVKQDKAFPVNFSGSFAYSRNTKFDVNVFTPSVIVYLGGANSYKANVPFLYLTSGVNSAGSSSNFFLGGGIGIILARNILFEAELGHINNIRYYNLKFGVAIKNSKEIKIEKGGLIDLDDNAY